MADMQKVAVGLLLACAVLLVFAGTFMNLFSLPEYGLNFNQTDYAVFNDTFASVGVLGSDTYDNVKALGTNQTDFWSRVQQAFSWIDVIISGVLVALNLMIFGIPLIIFTLLAGVLGTLGVGGGVFGVKTFFIGLEIALVSLFIVGGIFRIIFKEQP